MPDDLFGENTFAKSGPEGQLRTLMHDLTQVRRELAFALRAVDEASRSIEIGKRLTTASLTETRDLCLPHVTKSLLYATLEVLNEIRAEDGLPEDYALARKRTIDKLEKLDAKGVFTMMEEGQREEAIRRGHVLIRFADIMAPRVMVDIVQALEMLSSGAPEGPRVVVDGSSLTRPRNHDVSS